MEAGSSCALQPPVDPSLPANADEIIVSGSRPGKKEIKARVGKET
jgi:hypothetical protein